MHRRADPAVLPDDRLRDGLGTDWDLDALFPLLPPRVSEHIVVFRVELVRVVHLHGGDQVCSENLQHGSQGHYSALWQFNGQYNILTIAWILTFKNISNIIRSRQEKGSSQWPCSLAHSQCFVLIWLVRESVEWLGVSPQTTQPEGLCVCGCASLTDSLHWGITVRKANGCDATYRQILITADRGASYNPANIPRRVSAPCSSSAVLNVATSRLNCLR